jgi:hypothetical protein
MTNCMELSSSWKANRRSASQEVSHLLWNKNSLLCSQDPAIPSLFSAILIHVTAS